jgi:hypothetical protein
MTKSHDQQKSLRSKGIRYLYAWLLDGRELKKLLAIAEKARAHPRKRPSR